MKSEPIVVPAELVWLLLTCYRANGMPVKDALPHAIVDAVHALSNLANGTKVVIDAVTYTCTLAEDGVHVTPQT